MSRDLAVRLGFVAALVVGVLALSTPAYATTHTVSMAGFTFAPAQLTVHVGDTVIWVHDGSATPHSVTADRGSFDSSPNCPPTCMGAGATFQHTFTQAGTFAYHCKIHGAAGGIGMSGTIVVEPVAATTTTPATTPATAPPTTAAAGSGTTQPIGAATGPTPPPSAAGATSAGGTTTPTTIAPTLAFTGTSSGRGAMVGVACVTFGLGLVALRSRRSRPKR